MCEGKERRRKPLGTSPHLSDNNLTPVKRRAIQLADRFPGGVRVHKLNKPGTSVLGTATDSQCTNHPGSPHEQPVSVPKALQRGCHVSFTPAAAMQTTAPTLERPSAFVMTSARTTGPAFRMWSFNTCHDVLYARFPTNTFAPTAGSPATASSKLVSSFSSAMVQFTDVKLRKWAVRTNVGRACGVCCRQALTRGNLHDDASDQIIQVYPGSQNPVFQSPTMLARAMDGDSLLSVCSQPPHEDEGGANEPPRRTRIRASSTALCAGTDAVGPPPRSH